MSDLREPPPGAGTASNENAPRRLTVLLSLAAAVTMANAAFHGASRELSDPDGWWVAAAGRQMLDTGQVPHENGWSFTAPDHPWVMHEHGLGPLYALGTQAQGPMFFSMLSLLLALGLVGLVFVGASGRRSRDWSGSSLSAPP